MRALKVLYFVLILLWSRALFAQDIPDAFGPLFDDLTLQEATDRSIEESKLLIVYVDARAIPGADRDRSEICLRSAQHDRLLRFWLRQHAVAIHLGPEHRELAERIVLAAMARCERAYFAFDPYNEPQDSNRIPWYTPAFGIFLNGEFFAAVTACRTHPTLGLGFGGSPRNPHGEQMHWAVFDLEFQMDRIRAKEGVWHAIHELRNPILENQDLPEFASAEDANAEVYDESVVRDPGDIFRAITLARTQAHLGDRVGAAGTYTWLFERGAERDRDFGPAIRTLITADINELAGRWPNVQRRFEDMKNAGTSKLGAMSMEDFSAWVRLCAILEDDALLLEEFDRLLNDDYWGALMPRERRRLLFTIAETETEIITRVPGAGESLSDVRRLMTAADRETEPDVRHLRQRLALDHAVLVHTRLLEQGNDAEAIEVAEVAIKSAGDHAVRALAAGALVVGEARPWHVERLMELPGADPRADRLLAYLIQMLDDPQPAVP